MPIHQSQDPATDSSVGKLNPDHEAEVNGGSERRQHHELATNSMENEKELLWTNAREMCREAFSEFFGTMILVLFGDGVVAQVTLSRGTKGDYQSISWGWG